MNRRITLSYDIMCDINTDFEQLIVSLLWGAQCPMDPYSMDPAARQTFLQSIPEYNAAIAKLEAARAVFREAVAMRNHFRST
jgi:hypothetical protein